jgi:serine/threonine protein kinase
VEDIQKEISYLAQSRSEFVTKYLGSWLCEGSTRLAIAMEYMAGGSVADHIGERPLPEDACAVGPWQTTPAIATSIQRRLNQHKRVQNAC